MTVRRAYAQAVPRATHRMAVFSRRALLVGTSAHRKKRIMGFAFTALPHGGALPATTRFPGAGDYQCLRCARLARLPTDVLVRGVEVVFGRMLWRILGSARIGNERRYNSADSARGVLLLEVRIAALARTSLVVFMLGGSVMQWSPTTRLVHFAGLARIVPVVLEATILWKGSAAVFVSPRAVARLVSE